MAALSTLIDDFSGTTLDTTKWTDTSTAPSTTSVSGGKLHLTPVGTPPSQVTSATTYTWALSGIYTRIVPSTATDVRTSLIVQDATSSGLIEMYYLNGGMFYRILSTTGTVTVADTRIGTWDPIGWNYWLMSYPSGSTTLQRSQDSTTNITVATAAAFSGWGTTAYVRLLTSTTNASATPESLVDSVNVKSVQETTNAYPSPSRLTYIRTARTATIISPRTPGTSNTRTTAQRNGTKGVLATTAMGTSTVVSPARMTFVVQSRKATALTGSGTAVITRPTTGLLWPPGAWARR